MSAKASFPRTVGGSGSRLMVQVGAPHSHSRCRRQGRYNMWRSLVVVFLIVSGAVMPQSAAALPLPVGASIDPFLQQQMTANPLQRLPIIVEMEHVASPLSGAN